MRTALVKYSALLVMLVAFFALGAVGGYEPVAGLLLVLTIAFVACYFARPELISCSARAEKQIATAEENPPLVTGR